MENRQAFRSAQWGALRYFAKTGIQIKMCSEGVNSQVYTASISCSLRMYVWTSLDLIKSLSMKKLLILTSINQDPTIFLFCNTKTMDSLFFSSHWVSYIEQFGENEIIFLSLFSIYRKGIYLFNFIYFISFNFISFYSHFILVFKIPSESWTFSVTYVCFKADWDLFEALEFLFQKYQWVWKKCLFYLCFQCVIKWFHNEPKFGKWSCKTLTCN